MPYRSPTARAFFLSFAALTSVIAAQADEGMWTFDNFPSKQVRSQYGVEIDGPWLDRVRNASVRLAGCSASFVSAEGMILTNHHCITQCLAENSTKEKSLIDDGFIAAGREQELRCATQVADVLVKMQDVSGEVSAVTRGLDDRAANDARKRKLTELEQACEQASGNSCQSVTLYNGGQYFLYQYKRYTDVRLVFAPEAGIAAFGGDPDNFQFPRWCLDMALLRAYENGKPVEVADPLRINFAGPTAGEFVLVAGHPGSTDRLLTVSQLNYLRDVALPPALLRSSELRGRYIQFAKSDDGARRIVDSALSGIENGIKVRRKLQDALLDDSLLAQKRREEEALRQYFRTNRKFSKLGDPWAEIERANALARDLDVELGFIENAAAFNSRLFRYARSLVRAAAEREKPNTERLREYTDTTLPRLEQQLAAAAPVYPELEQLTLSFGLERMREWLGPDHPVVRDLLATESPDSLARRLIADTRLADPRQRKALWSADMATLRASDDAMIQLALRVDPLARQLRKRYEDEVESVIRAAEEKIAQARFARSGTAVYPDATFTLRLNYGTVQGWQERGTTIEPYTQLSRAFERSTGQDPFRIPQSWLNVKDTLDLSTPFNLSSNNDIIGGNSGSPLLNARGEVVGLIFDGNIHSISGAYWFDQRKNRSVAVHTAIMREALTKVYPAEHLLRELEASGSAQ